MTSPQITANTRFDLSGDIWIEKLGKEFATKIQGACEPAHYKIDSDIYDPHLYAFLRSIPKNETARKESLLDLFTVILRDHPKAANEGHLKTGQR